MHKLLEGLAIKTTFLTQYLSNLNPEGEVSSTKIDGFKGNYISKLKWAWQAQFLSYVLLILRNNLFFEDKQMILLSLFDISTSFRFQKNLKSFPIQVFSHPWSICHKSTSSNQKMLPTNKSCHI